MTSRNQKNNSQLNQFLNDYSNALIAVILILFLAAAYWFLLYPKFLTIQSSLKTAGEETQNLYNIYWQKLVNLKSVNESYKKISAVDLQKFNSVLPDEYVPERLFGELEEIVSRGGWLIGNISLKPVKIAAPALFSSSTPITFSNKKLNAISVSLSISAIDYQGLKNLLKILENNLRLFDVTSVSFSPSSNSVNLVLTTYYYAAK
ncbi:MAG: hypothetical protein WC863_01005 [Patescibacteria group bacterium]